MMFDINLKNYKSAPLENGKGQRNRLHPHKFTLWVAIGSIIMMFAGLTSAYIVKSGQAGWHEVKTPTLFWASTAVLFASSVTIQAALRNFKHRAMTTFRTLLLVTLALGILFVILQYMGFQWLWERGVHFEGSSEQASFCTSSLACMPFT